MTISSVSHASPLFSWGITFWSWTRNIFSSKFLTFDDVIYEKKTMNFTLNDVPKANFDASTMFPSKQIVFWIAKIWWKWPQKYGLKLRGMYINNSLHWSHKPYISRFHVMPHGIATSCHVAWCGSATSPLPFNNHPTCFWCFELIQNLIFTNELYNSTNLTLRIQLCRQNS